MPSEVREDTLGLVALGLFSLYGYAVRSLFGGLGREWRDNERRVAHALAASEALQIERAVARRIDHHFAHDGGRAVLDKSDEPPLRHGVAYPHEPGCAPPV